MTLSPGNWQDWSHFFAFNLDGLEATHYLWKFGNNVSAPLMSESNRDYIAAEMTKIGAEFKMSTTGAGLSGVHYYSALVRIRDDSGQPTPAEALLEMLMKRLDGYPIFDWDDYTDRVSRQHLDSIAFELKLGFWVDWDIPDDLDEVTPLVLSEIERQGHDTWEGWYPDREDLEAALYHLGHAPYSELEKNA